MFDHVVGDTAKNPDERPRNMNDNAVDENGYYIDRALNEKEPPILRIKEDKVEILPSVPAIG